MRFEWYPKLNEVVMIPQTAEDHKWVDQFPVGYQEDIDIRAYLEVERSDRSQYITINFSRDRVKDTYNAK